jgi:hypothetical protein
MSKLLRVRMTLGSSLGALDPSHGAPFRPSMSRERGALTRGSGGSCACYLSCSSAAWVHVGRGGNPSVSARSICRASGLLSGVTVLGKEITVVPHQSARDLRKFHPTASIPSRQAGGASVLGSIRSPPISRTPVAELGSSDLRPLESAGRPRSPADRSRSGESRTRAFLVRTSRTKCLWRLAVPTEAEKRL